MQAKDIKESVPHSGEEATRERIIRAAADEFVEHGLQGARIQRIAERSGANKAMIYYYFHSKQELYEQIFRHVMGRGLQRVFGIMAERNGFEDKIASLVEFYCDLYGDKKRKKMLLRELAEGAPRMRKVIEEMKSGPTGFPLRELWFGVLEEAKKSGRLRDVDPLNALASLIGMAAGFYLLQPVYETALNLTTEESKHLERERKAEIVNILLNGILKK